MIKFFYRVEEGDTVTGLSKRFCLPTAKLIKLNNLKSEISSGDLLYIEQSETKLYYVKPFDRLEDIASANKISPKELLENNGVEYIFYGLVLDVAKNQ